MDNKLILACDIDGVLRNFNQMLTQFYNAYLGVDKASMWIDLDYECPKYELFTGEEYNNEAIQYVWENYRFELMMYARPYKDYNKFLDRIRFILTHSSWWNSKIKFITHQYSEEAELATSIWFKKWGLSKYGDLVFSHGDNKWEQCDALIDDKKENLYQLRDNKKDSLPICCARGWNSDIDEDIFRGNYIEIIKYISKKLVC